MKTKVEKFNSLPIEERCKIGFYRLQTQILTLAQCLSLIEDSIGPYQKRKINEWIKSLKNYMDDKYDYEEAYNET